MVIMSGLRRSSQPLRTASAVLSPSCLSWLKKVTSITPFSTAMPKSTMKPIAVETLRLILSATMVRIPPTRAKGRLTITRKAFRMDPRAEKSIRKMSRTETGTTTLSRFMARCWFSNCPPYSMK